MYKYSSTTSPSSTSVVPPVAQDNINVTPIPTRSLSDTMNEIEVTPKPAPVMTPFSPTDYFPMVRRGAVHAEEEEKVMSSGWKQDVTSRREREENIFDEVKRFETKKKSSKSFLSGGLDGTLWQLHRNDETNEKPEFVVKATPVHVKLESKEESLIRAQIVFAARGGYLSKALGRGMFSFSQRGLYIEKKI